MVPSEHVVVLVVSVSSVFSDEASSVVCTAAEGSLVGSGVASVTAQPSLS